MNRQTTRLLPIVASIASLWAAAVCAEVSNFTSDGAWFDPQAGETASFRFDSDQGGEAFVRIYGPDWREIGEVTVEEVVAGETTQVAWDGRDQDGNIVPDEAYFGVLEFFGADDDIVQIDRSVERAIGEVLVLDAAYDAAAGGVRFRLAVPARVTLLAGISGGGPLMNTLLSGVPYPAGEHVFPWDGRDQSGVIDLVAEERFQLFVSARELVAPVVIARGGDGPAYHSYTRDLSDAGIPIKEPVDPDVFGGAPHLLPKPVDISPEPVFSLSVPGAETNAEGVPQVTGQVPLQVSLGDKIKVPVLARRFEIVLFHNFEFTTEIEEGRSPATIVWDASRLPPGRYLVTINVATLPGQLSAASTFVDIPG